MAKFIPEQTLLLILNEINKSDEEVGCSTQPLTYFNAIHPDVWLANTIYTAGATVRAPADNGFVYECVVGGTTGSVEPGWAATQDAEFTDGTVTWKAHENYALANYTLEAEDKTILPGDTSGYVFSVAQIATGIVAHRSGTLGHMALIEHASKKLHHVTTAQTTFEADNLVESGRSTVFYELIVNIDIT